MARHVVAQSARAAVAALALVAGVTARAQAEGPQAWGEEAAAGSVSHIRAADPRAQMLLRQGVARSRTFRGLVERLEQSGLIVYVETGAFDRPGALVFAAATASARFVRIRVRASGRPETELLAWLGHELQHAVEIAGAPDVRDEQTLARLYRRIGSMSRSTCETRAAGEIWARVRDEAGR